MSGVSASTLTATFPLPLVLALLAGCSGDSRGARIDAPRGTASAATPASAMAPPNTVSPPPPPKAWSTFRELVMTAEDCKAAPRASITRAEAAADAAVVERIVRRGWAGLDVMTKSGVDFAALFADLARWIADAPEPIAVGVFHDRLVQALRPAADNHMAFFEYLTVRTFWSAKDTELSAFVASGEKLREAKAIVVDLRGNGGGSDTYAKDWLAQLTNQKLVGAIDVIAVDVDLLYAVAPSIA